VVKMTGKKLFATYQFKCRGVDKDNRPVLEKGTEPAAFLRIYEDGESLPICQYVHGDKDNLCGASDTDPEKTRRIFCPYRTS